MDIIRLQSTDLMNASGLVRAANRSFRCGDRRSAFSFLTAWDLPLWAISQIANGGYDVADGNVVIRRLPQSQFDKELDNIMAVVGLEVLP